MFVFCTVRVFAHNINELKKVYTASRNGQLYVCWACIEFRQSWHIHEPTENVERKLVEFRVFVCTWREKKNTWKKLGTFFCKKASRVRFSEAQEWFSVPIDWITKRQVHVWESDVESWKSTTKKRQNTAKIIPTMIWRKMLHKHTRFPYISTIFHVETLSKFHI